MRCALGRARRTSPDRCRCSILAWTLILPCADAVAGHHRLPTRMALRNCVYVSCRPSSSCSVQVLTSANGTAEGIMSASWILVPIMNPPTNGERVHRRQAVRLTVFLAMMHRLHVGRPSSHLIRLVLQLKQPVRVREYFCRRLFPALPDLRTSPSPSSPSPSPSASPSPSPSGSSLPDVTGVEVALILGLKSNWFTWKGYGGGRVGAVPGAGAAAGAAPVAGDECRLLWYRVSCRLRQTQGQRQRKEKVSPALGGVAAKLVLQQRIARRVHMIMCPVPMVGVAVTMTAMPVAVTVHGCRHAPSWLCSESKTTKSSSSFSLGE